MLETVLEPRILLNILLNVPSQRDLQSETWWLLGIDGKMKPGAYIRMNVRHYCFFSCLLHPDEKRALEYFGTFSPKFWHLFLVFSIPIEKIVFLCAITVLELPNSA